MDLRGGALFLQIQFHNWSSSEKSSDIKLFPIFNTSFRMCGVTSAALTLGVVDEDQEPEGCTNHSTGVQVLIKLLP